MSNQALFLELNAQMGQLIGERVAAVYGTSAERELMTSITVSGIESAEELIALINEGLTYDKWKAFLTRSNAIDGVLGKFENEAGDMARLVEAFAAADLRETFDQFVAEGVFTEERIRADIVSLKSRLTWAETMWAITDEAAAAEANGPTDVLELVKGMDADTHNELVRHGDPEFLQQLDEAAQAQLAKGSDQ